MGYSGALLASALFTLLCLSAQAQAATYATVAPDPVCGSGMGGFNRIHYITQGPHRGKVLSPLSCETVVGNNSIGLYDPVTNTWNRTLIAAALDGRPTNRDNQGSFYVPALNEFWIWGGSHMEEHPAFKLLQWINSNGVAATSLNMFSASCVPSNVACWGASEAQFITVNPSNLQASAQPFIDNFNWTAAANQAVSAGRLNLALSLPAWTTIGLGVVNHATGATTYCANFPTKGGSSGIADGCLPFTGTDPATAWSETLDAGIVCCGDPSNSTTYVVEPNTLGGAERYMITRLTGVPMAGREQAMNIAVAAGSDFYVTGTFAGNIDSKATFTRDLWRLRKVAGVWTWTQMAAPPTTGFQSFTPTLTYDSDANVLIAYMSDTHTAATGAFDGNATRVFQYSITNNTWSDITPAGAPCVYNNAGVYAPISRMHVYQGGNFCLSGSGNTQSYRVQLAPYLNIGERKWVAYDYDKYIPTPFPYNINGEAGFKHGNIAVNTSNGKFYFVGGDANVDQGTGDNRGVWTWDPLAAQNGTTAVVQEHANCGAFGDVMPGGPNESGFVYDSLRNKFWIIPGFWFLVQSGPAGCGASVLWNTASPTTITGKAYYAINESTGARWYSSDLYPSACAQLSISRTSAGTSAEQQTITNTGNQGDLGGAGANCTGGVMPSQVRLYYQPPTGAYQLSSTLTYDPVTQKWANPNAAGESTVYVGEKPKFAVYDAATDSIWRIGNDANGIRTTRYFPATNTWVGYDQDSAFFGDPFNDTLLKFEWYAFDSVNRMIYVIDPLNYRLLQFDLSTAANGRIRIRRKAAPPPPPYGYFSASAATTGNACGSNDNGLVDFTQPHYANGKILFPWICSLGGFTKLFIYDIATDTWEADAMTTQPSGLTATVKGNMTAYNSVYNAFLVIGGLCGGQDALAAPDRTGGIAEPCEPQNGTPHENAGNPDPNLTNFWLYRYGPGGAFAPEPGPTPVVIKLGSNMKVGTGKNLKIGVSP